MNILMIGNGFDLEHGLPTKYTDFLKFIKDFNQAYYSPHNTTALQEFENIYFSAAFHNGINPSDHETIINALRKLIYGNLWINYFIKVHDEHLFLKENWIDFESEISSVVQTMDRLRTMIFDLNRLICAFEIYIAFYIDHIKIKYYALTYSIIHLTK